MVNPVAWYEANAAAVSAQYEDVSVEAVHAWLLDLLPSLPAAVLDVGAGSGRDAAWLAAQGYDVVAVEPSPAMRKGAQDRHPNAAIRWLADSLPGLEQTLKTGLSFDLILLSAVWMHVAPTDRLRAFRSWQPKRDGERNEALDTFVYAHAVLHGLISMGIRFNEEMEGMVGQPAQPQHAATGIVRSAWMG